MTGRNTRPPMNSEYDIVVIGGGINGVAIARECARAGRSVLLVEKNDFGSGTTSRTTRIVHGGLRYLEHGELSLVRESLRERGRLMRERPHLVRPLKFVFALNENSRHSALQLRAGLWLYRQLSRTRARNGHTADVLAELERRLDSGQRWALFQYDDAQCEYPERLVAEWLVEALHAGATARNHTEVLEVRTSDGRVQGVRVRDLLSGVEQFVRADWVVNATGPWADHVYAASGLQQARPMVGGVRGSHIVVPTFEGAPSTALYSEASDGRPVFVIPWNGQVLIGTTEVEDRRNPDLCRPAPAEIQYLLRAVHRLYPRARLTTADITYAFAGIRALPYTDTRNTAGITRRHVIRNHAEEGAMGFLSVIGGKLTTAAEVARQTARKVGVRCPEPQNVWVATGSASGIESTFGQWSQMVSLATGITEQAARAVAIWHGRCALPIAQMAGTDERFRRPICEHTDHIVAEAVSAVRYEHAVTLGDMLLRRVPVALSGCFGQDCAELAAERIGRALGWDARQIVRELDAFYAERESFLVNVERPDRFRAPELGESAA
ncbi:MAG TPA: glycerol-3-phosphate dehydrogenase/oxidase [Clostridia bacterium]|nr:glycerol-3-phosphate dehydrogenase/oxidase [Clostridia bacterium]